MTNIYCGGCGHTFDHTENPLTTAGQVALINAARCPHCKSINTFTPSEATLWFGTAIAAEAPMPQVSGGHPTVRTSDTLAPRDEAQAFSAQGDLLIPIPVRFAAAATVNAPAAPSKPVEQRPTRWYHYVAGVFLGLLGGTIGLAMLELADEED